MENKVAKGHPIVFSILIAVGLTLWITVATAAATIAELDETGLMMAQALAFFVISVIIAYYMKKRDASLNIFGFKKIELRNERAVLYYIPLLMIALVQPIVGGFNFDLTFSKVLLILVFSLLVGFTEESIFRGIIREKLKFKGSQYYIVFSSILFGVLHAVNALSGKDPLWIILQVINAFLIGIIMALLVEITGQIVPLIIFHFLFDALAQMTNIDSINQEIMNVSILNILYILYGVQLVFVLLQKRKINKQVIV